VVSQATRGLFANSSQEIAVWLSLFTERAEAYFVRAAEINTRGEMDLAEAYHRGCGVGLRARNGPGDTDRLARRACPRIGAVSMSQTGYSRNILQPN
jgi:hypothetical protein